MKKHNIGIKIFLVLLAIIFAALPLAAALGSDTLPAPTPASTVAPSLEQPKRLNNLKTRGASEIDRRLDRLQQALDKAQTGTKLPESTKKQLVSQLQNEITSLTNIKSKLSSGTDLAAARLDVQKIIDDYRVYGLLLPKARIIAAADRYYLAEERLKLLRAQLQHGINVAKQQGKNVTALQKSQDNLIKRLAAAEKHYKELPNKLINLPTADYPASHKLLAQSTAGLKAARTDIAVAEDEAKKILTGLRGYSKS